METPTMIFTVRRVSLENQTGRPAYPQSPNRNNEYSSFFNFQVSKSFITCKQGEANARAPVHLTNSFQTRLYEEFFRSEYVQ